MPLDSVIKEWISKSDGDRISAKRLLLTINGDDVADSVCFHSHAAVEKYLKALLFI